MLQFVILLYIIQKEFFLYVVGTAITKRKLALICKYDLMKLQWLVLAALIRIVTILSQSSDVALFYCNSDSSFINRKQTAYRHASPRKRTISQKLCPYSEREDAK